MTPLVPEGSTPVSPRASSFTLGGVAFGPWQLDIAAQSLWRQGVCLQLTPLQFAVLQLLTANAGSVVSKQTLLTKVWGDVAVGDNSIERLMSDLRMILDADDRRQYIQTMTRRGYVFVAPVRRIEPPAQVEVESLLEPYRACLEGRVALQTLTREEILRARGIYQNLATQYPDRAAYHGGLAMACALVFESTRADVNPDIETLTVALSHARTACQLNPAVAEPFATLGFILERVGDRSGAIGALERACALEPENWLHNYRLAAVSWGQARHRAARSVLQQCPGFPMAHLLVATVLVARQRCVDAEAEVDAGIKALRDGETDGAQFLSVAVYYLKGLLCLSRGAVDDALAAFDAELALEGRGHFYARECCANVWYAKGVPNFRELEPTQGMAARRGGPAARGVRGRSLKRRAAGRLAGPLRSVGEGRSQATWPQQLCFQPCRRTRPSSLPHRRPGQHGAPRPCRCRRRARCARGCPESNRVAVHVDGYAYLGSMAMCRGTSSVPVSICQTERH